MTALPVHPLPVHPFPARMAPDLALSRLPPMSCVEPRLVVLDPMMGSGTIPVLAALRGHAAVGLDMDPLAVMIARTWGRPMDATAFEEAARRVVQRAREAPSEPTWRDVETRDFADYWFDPAAQLGLASLASAIIKEDEDLHDALRCALSRLIITKDAGASRARDVSHSRPHRVRTKASFDPLDRFEHAARVVAHRHRQASESRPTIELLRLESGDARDVPLADGSVDVVMTSPPYLQAIDYLRGHRLSLIWFGHSTNELRELRGSVVGAERMAIVEIEDEAIIAETAGDELTSRARGILSRYIQDLSEIVEETRRVVRDDGRVIFVVAEATLFGRPVKVSRIVDLVADRAGLVLDERVVRPIKQDRRYLPPPSGGDGTLDKRMRDECCLTFSVAA
jgi:hypothetical protein